MTDKECWIDPDIDEIAIFKEALKAMTPAQLDFYVRILADHMPHAHQMVRDEQARRCAIELERMIH